MELERAQRQLISIRPPEAICFSRPRAAKNGAAFARFMADHIISIGSHSREDTDAPPSQSEKTSWARLLIFKLCPSPTSLGACQSSGHYRDVLQLREERRCANSAVT